MRILPAILLSLWAHASHAQVQNPPQYADGVITVAGGSLVTTNLTNARVPPGDLVVYAMGAITTWDVILPPNPFDGQNVTFACPGGNVSTFNAFATFTIGPGGMVTCTAGSGITTTYQFSLAQKSWIVRAQTGSGGGGGGSPAGSTGDIQTNGGGGVFGFFTPGTNVVTTLQAPANTSGGIATLGASPILGDCPQYNSSGAFIPVACGGGGSNVTHGRVTLSNGAFILSVTYASTPDCQAQDFTTYTNPAGVVPTTTTLTFSGVGSDVIVWICGD